MNFWYFELPPGNNDRKNLGKRRLNKDIRRKAPGLESQRHSQGRPGLRSQLLTLAWTRYGCCWHWGCTQWNGRPLPAYLQIQSFIHAYTHTHTHTQVFENQEAIVKRSI